MTLHVTERTELDDTQNEPELVPGKWYTFHPPITAYAMPTTMSNTCEPIECRFSRGWLIRTLEGKNVFFGKPIDDRRHISIPRILANLKNVADYMRTCYFVVPASANVTIQVDENQHA